MALDSLKQQVASHVEKRTETRREGKEFDEEHLQIKEVGALLENLDPSIQRENAAMQSHYEAISSDFARRFEELEEERTRLSEDVSDKMRSNNTAKDKLSTLQGNKYGHHGEAARRMSEEIDKDLQRMFKELDGNYGGDVSGISGGTSDVVSGVRSDSVSPGPDSLSRASTSPDRIPLASYTKTDDNGQPFMTEDGQLRPNISYTCNGYTYHTDGRGLITSWEGYGTYVPEEDRQRDNKAQLLCGGADRLPGDQGSHFAAIVNGGSPGLENQAPMRGTVNQGDYKKSEGQVTDALLDGQKVWQSGKVLREDPSTTRPTKFVFSYSYGDVFRELTADNVEGSTALLDMVRERAVPDEYKSLCDDIAYYQQQGDVISVTSVLLDMDARGNVKSISVGIRNETDAARADKKYGDAKTYVTIDC